MPTIRQVAGTQVYLLEDDDNKKKQPVRINPKLLQQDLSKFKVIHTYQEYFNARITMYIEESFLTDGKHSLVIYTDGSWKKSDKDICGAAAIIYDSKGTLMAILQINIKHDLVIKSHHIVGELIAAQTAVQLFKNSRIKLCHDYDGIYRLLLPEGDKRHYTAKTEITKLYKAMMLEEKNLLQRVKFVSVTSHADDIRNHIVDYYANKSRYRLNFKL